MYPDGTRDSFGDVQPIIPSQEVRLYLKKPSFFYRVAMGADIGFAEAYMCGDVEFDTSDDLTRCLKLFIANRDTGELQVSNLAPSLFGRAVNKFIHSTFNKNTLKGSQKNIEAHYDLSNELFATFLGPSWLYSCAYWKSSKQTLEEAQEEKMNRIIRKASIAPSDHVLDIGCGWGGICTLCGKEDRLLRNWYHFVQKSAFACTTTSAQRWVG